MHSDVMVQLHETIAQLVAVSQQLQTQSTENDSLRREIDVLERRLAQRTAVPPR